MNNYYEKLAELNNVSGDKIKTDWETFKKLNNLNYNAEHDYFIEIVEYEYKTDYKARGYDLEKTLMIFKSLFFEKEWTFEQTQHYLYDWWISSRYQEFKKTWSPIKAPPCYFVTVGFNHQTWSVSSCVVAIKNILASKQVQNDSYGVFELHRANGLHPHVHFKIVLGKHLRPSKVAEFIFRTRDVSKVCLKQSFIDVKPWLPCHENYLMGDKQEDKLQYCDLDKIWRETNQIPHIFTRSV